jgi:hypothetical protein
LKTFNHTNFFKHTFCEFTEIENFEFPKNSHFKSSSNSHYFYTKEGVFRKSNHWGKVANCHWKIITKTKYKNQQIVIGFASWDDFFAINSSEKNFTIFVDFDKDTAKIESLKTSSEKPIFTFLEAQQKLKKIREILQNNSWTTYFNQNTKEIQQLVIHELLNSSKSLQQIKQDFKR